MAGLGDLYDAVVSCNWLYSGRLPQECTICEFRALFIFFIAVFHTKHSREKSFSISEITLEAIKQKSL